MKTLIVAAGLVGVLATGAAAQRGSGSSASTVSAELIKGRLSPAESHPGDQITLRLRGDVKSNGNLVLKKGMTITGVVGYVNPPEDKTESGAKAESVIEVQWLAPSAEDLHGEQLMIAMQSVTQISSLARQDSDNDGESGGPQNHSTYGHSLLNENTAAAHASNAALLSMPSVVVADPQTATILGTTLGVADGQRLFQTGHGQVVSPGGYKDSIDIFSYLNNDTVLTSHSRNFELSSGAQMQLLVGMQKQ